MSRVWKVEMGRMWFELTKLEQITHLWGWHGYQGLGCVCTEILSVGGGLCRDTERQERLCLLCRQLAL